jgi:hypothetical protein
MRNNRHQRQALTFFRRREQGLHPTEESFGMWSRQTIGDDSLYDRVSLYYTSLMLTIMPSSFVNAITSQECSMPGPLWRGGLLADEMGLGKTLSMIALVASDLQTDTSFSHELPSTLIIVPLSCKHKYRPS